MSASGETRIPVRLRVEIAEVRPVQAELLLQPPHVQHTALDQPFGLGPVGVIDLDRDLRAECRSVPPHGIAGLQRFVPPARMPIRLPSQQ